MTQNGLGFSGCKGKEAGINKETWNCDARQTSEHIIGKSGAWFHILLMNIYMNYNYNYNYGTMTQDHGFHSCDTDVGEVERATKV